MSWRDWLASWFTRLGFFHAPQSLGQRGEAEAARFLERQGYQIVARGERARLGEIDLVAVEGRTVVFVEVKTRASDHSGAPAEAVDEAKQRRITRTALLYMKRHDLLEVSSRFDIISITWPAQGKPQIDHLRGAFEPTGTDGFFS